MTYPLAPLVLGIETSCDETGAGLVRGHELLADSVASSVAEHARFGGVVLRWPAARTWRPWSRRWTGRWPWPGSRWPTWTRSR